MVAVRSFNVGDWCRAGAAQANSMLESIGSSTVVKKVKEFAASAFNFISSNLNKFWTGLTTLSPKYKFALVAVAGAGAVAAAYLAQKNMAPAKKEE